MTILEKQLYDSKNKLSLLLMRLSTICATNIASIPKRLRTMVLNKNKIKTFIEDGILFDLNEDDLCLKTKIYDYDFIGNTSLVSITMPYGIKSIGKQAFDDCSNLTNVIIPNSVTTIDEDAFYDCRALKNIVIPDSITRIGSWALRCNASDLNVYITDIVKWANISFIDSFSNPLHNSNSSLYLNNELVTNLDMPDNTTSINQYAFYNYKKLTNINIPNSVTSIGKDAFKYTGLTSITIPFVGSSPSSSGNSAKLSYIIDNTSSLKEVIIGNCCTSINNGAFEGYKYLTNIVIPDSVTTIGRSAFSGCTGLTNIIIPNSVTTLDGSAFSGCDNLERIDVDINNNMYLSDESGILFNKNQTTIVKYPGNHTETTYTIPDSVTTIGDDAFSDCSSLTSVTIPDSVTTINKFAFLSCKSLTSIIIPNSVTSIGTNAFISCHKLTNIYIKSTIPPSLDTLPFPTFATIHVPVGSGDAYRNATNWSHYASKIVEDPEL